MKCFFKSILTFTFFFLFCHVCKALDVYQFIDTRAQSMGNTMSILPGFANPASYGSSISKFASLEYLNRYGVKELSTYAAKLNVPNNYLNTGIYISRYGFSEYNQLQISGNFYRKLSSHIALGIRLNYLNLHYSERESSKSLLTGDIGMLIEPDDKWKLSVLLVNPFRMDYQIGGEKLKTSGFLVCGASYQLSKEFLLTGEVEKEFISPVRFKVGGEYTPIKELRLRMGMFTGPFTPTFGVGLHVNSFMINLSFHRHPVLGFESGCSLQFNY